jgi:hypothetical protein
MYDVSGRDWAQTHEGTVATSRLCHVLRRDHRRAICGCVLTFHGSLDILQYILPGEYTFGKEVTEDPFHVELIKHNLTKNLNAIFPAV